jgi:hypothetical protein
MTRTTHVLILIAVASVAAVATRPALAQPFEVEWHSIDGGSLTTNTTPDFELSGTVGQPDAGVHSGNGPAGPFEISGGFWVVKGAELPCPADFDGSGGTPDANDISAFFDAWLVGDQSADVDGSGGTPDANDINFFFVAWLNGGCDA